ncbi:MAG: phosphotransferase [Myxococcales bacterium]|nr:phosphotransferase [Myxococcales bacterium]
MPATAEDVDARWLEAALAARHPGVRVAGVELVEAHEATNAHARLRVAYEADAGCPATLFCKLLPTREPTRAAIAATGMGLREALFYERLAHRLALRTPAVHAALCDEATGAFALLLEDLRATGCTISTGPEGVAPDAAARALEELAQMHARYASAERRRAEAGFVRAPDPPSDYGVTRLRYGLDHHRERLAPAFAELAELYVARRDAVHAAWEDGPRTVVHGDTHVGNLFDDAGRTGFLDWGIVHVGTPLREVSYFLTMAMAVDDRRAHERDLWRVWLDAFAANGGEPIAFDDAWRAHRLHAAYTVPASCQVVTFPDDASPARRVFADAFLARAEAAVEDLEARAALRDLKGV